jgi:lysophospholipase L1-like esterase
MDIVFRLFIILAGLFVIGYVLVASGYAAYRISIGKQFAEEAVPFSRELEAPRIRILTIGDSTVVGTGVSESRFSIAGRLAEDFPEADIINEGQNGLRAADVTRRISLLEGSYDLVLVQAGGNDIIRFTKLEQLRGSVSTILREAKRLSPNVLILHSGNVGLAPFFPWPWSVLASWRAAQVRELYMELAEGAGAHYVDLFTTKEEDPFRHDYARYYASDGLHLSDMGYGIWYERIRRTMDSAGITL